MLPYTVIKEANPPRVGGTATGVMHFINFSFSAFLGPVFGDRLMAAAAGQQAVQLEHYQPAFAPLLAGSSWLSALAFLLRETGPRRSVRTS